MKGYYSSFPKLRDGNLTIRLFKVISRILMTGDAEMQSLYSTAPADKDVEFFRKIFQTWIVAAQIVLCVLFGLARLSGSMEHKNKMNYFN